MESTSMSNNALFAVFKHTLQDIYNSETQIASALPDMMQAAQSPDLRQALGDHLTETQEHVRRVSEACSLFGIETGNVTCQATAGLVREAKEQIQEFAPGPAGDVAIIACAQKVEHYEICGYGTVIEWAEKLDVDHDGIKLLKENLKDEANANEKLNHIATHHVNKDALEAQFATINSGPARLY
jgi:ferritin-like metal-binding protein YciE